MSILGDVVAVPGGDFDDDFSRLDDLRLATEARIQLQVGGHIEPVGFFIVELAQQFLALANYHMTSGAGAVAAAGMLKVNPEVERYIQQRLRLAVILVRQLAGFEFECFVGG